MMRKSAAQALVVLAVLDFTADCRRRSISSGEQPGAGHF